MSKSETTLPSLETHWETDALDTGRIHDELNRMWASLGGPPHAGQTPGEQVASTHLGGGDLMRSNTLNLIAVADNELAARVITQSVSQLKDYLPSRAIVFITDTEVERAHTWTVDLRLNESTETGTDNILRFETIMISAHPKVSGYLASVVSPLLISELPTYLWWPNGDFMGKPFFDDLSHIADRLIVDSALLGNDAGTVSQLRQLVDEPDDPVVGDFTWARLQPWRQLVAQFFDPAETRHCLDEVTDITVEYAEHRSDNSSGFAAALIIIGWLASRLGWEVTETLERRRKGGWSVPLRSVSDDGKAHDVLVRLIPDPAPGARFSLRSVELVAGGACEGRFQVRRTDEDDLITSSHTRTSPEVSRMVYARRQGPNELLEDELRRLAADKTLEDSIRIATQLLP